MENLKLFNSCCGVSGKFKEIVMVWCIVFARYLMRTFIYDCCLKKIGGSEDSTIKDSQVFTIFVLTLIAIMKYQYVKAKWKDGIYF